MRHQTPETMAANALSRHTRSTIGYGVIVWRFDSQDALDKAYSDAVEAVGKDFISLVNIRLHRNEATPFGEKANYIQIFT